MADMVHRLTGIEFEVDRVVDQLTATRREFNAPNFRRIVNWFIRSMIPIDAEIKASEQYVISKGLEKAGEYR